MKVFEVVDQALVSWFLRTYARNLKRSYRNDPESAAADAETQLSTMLLMGIGVLLLIVGAILFPSFLRKFFSGGDGMYLAVVALGVAVVYGVHKRFGSYDLNSESARRYIASGNSGLSPTIYWVVMIGSIAIIWALFWHRKS